MAFAHERHAFFSYDVRADDGALRRKVNGTAEYNRFIRGKEGYEVDKFSKTLRSALTCSKILQSKIVALYEDAKARRHKLDMREKRAEPSPEDAPAQDTDAA